MESPHKREYSMPIYDLEWGEYLIGKDYEYTPIQRRFFKMDQNEKRTFYLELKKYLCDGCGDCIVARPEQILTGSEKNVTFCYNIEKCTFCGICVRTYPQKAITLHMKQE